MEGTLGTFYQLSDRFWSAARGLNAHFFGQIPAAGHLEEV
jgi:hypothetical protein